MRPRSITIGTNKETGRRVKLSPLRRSTHVHVPGSSGRGKSKFFEVGIRQDIQFGHGVCVIDPHGTLYHNVLRWIASNDIHKQRKIYLFDPTLSGWSCGFNPLEFQAETAAHLDYAVNSLVTTISHVFGSDNTDHTPLLERMLTVCIYALVVNQLTLVEMPMIISSLTADFKRQRLISNVGDWFIAQQLDELNSMRPREFREHLGSTYNRISRFLSSPVIRNILGQREDVLNVRQIIEDGDILLVNLSTGSGVLSIERARLLGSMLLNSLFLAGEMRSEDSDPFYVWIDECHRFLTGDLESILNESRKRGIHVALAHQNLGQLRKAGDAIYSAVMGSAQTKIVFGLEDMNDAEEMARNIFAHPDDINLEEPKRSLVTWQTTGYRTIWLKSAATSYGKSSGYGTSWALSVGQAYTSSRSSHRAVTDSDAYSDAGGMGSFQGTGASTHLGQTSLPDGTVLISTTGESGSLMSGASLFNASSYTHGHSVSEGMSEGEALTESVQLIRGGSRNTQETVTHTRGQHEALAPIIEPTYMHTYSLQEQQFRKAILVKNLGVADSVVKVPTRKSLPLAISGVRPGHATDARVQQLVVSLCQMQDSVKDPAVVEEQILRRHERLLLAEAEPQTLGEPEWWKGSPAQHPQHAST